MDALILGLRVFVALGAVLGLMWLVQRRLVKGAGRRRADHALKIVSRQSVGQKASVVVVDAAGQRFLLGVTEHAVNVLHTGDIPAEPVEATVPGTRQAAGDFARVLSGFSPADVPSPRRNALHRNSHTRPATPRPGTPGGAGQPPLHGSILAGSTWKQAAAALRGGRRS